jgi:AcrR family transcriptional regulator
MTRPAEYTRNLIIKAAVSLFAEKGFERSSVRDIVTKARVNQAAINYHFKGKDGLYLEVLKIAFKTLTEDAGLDADELKSLSREQALAALRAPSAAPVAFSGRNEPLHTDVRVGKRTSIEGLSEVYSDQYKLIPLGRARYRTALSATEHTRSRGSLCGDMLDGAMQRFCEKPRTLCARSVSDDHRRAVRR